MKSKKIASTPFRFVGCIELKEMLGIKSRDEEDLMEKIEDVPLDSIYYHVYGYLLRHQYLLGPYPNDFASWVALEVRDDLLAEKLALMDPLEYDDLENLRGRIIEVIGEHLNHTLIIPRAVNGHPFFFMKSRMIEVPTGIEVKTLQEFRDALQVVDSSVIFNHCFAATRSLTNRLDFLAWIEKELGFKDLCYDLKRINFYMISLENIRERILKLCDACLK